ncbi:hypothetical protein [Modestobacter sp. SYSU DS0875]
MAVPVPRLPWWAQSLLVGLLCALAGVGAALLVSHDDLGRDLAQALLSGLVVGFAGGLGTAWNARRQDARFREATAGLGDDGARAAHRAVRRGPVPGDPRVREAAVRLLDVRLDVATQHPGLNLACILLVGGYAAVQALTRTPWWWLGVLVALGAAVSWYREPVRLRRRRAELTGDPVAA